MAADHGLAHESPSALSVRPTVALRPVPGVAIRVPSRGATILLVATLVLGASVALTPLPWTLLAALLLAPTALLIALVELRPRGRAPLAWLVLLARRRSRPARLLARPHPERP